MRLLNRAARANHHADPCAAPRACALAQHQPFFLQLAFGVALAVFIALEYCRLGNIYPIGKGLHAFLSGFTDYRDSGPFIMSHIYLLVGCALPVWFTGYALRPGIHPARCHRVP